MQTLTQPTRAAGDFLHLLRSLTGFDARAGNRPEALAPTCRLEPSEMRELGDAEGATVECLSGCVWITFDGDPRDVMLQAGQSHRADRRTRALVSALEVSAIRLHLRPAR